jgi:hypothetical protein
MKYLITREQFLSKNTGSTMVNESVLEAPITWGGSLLGRMVNSTIRRVKIGYNESQIDQVLVDLRNELDYLLSSSITGDAEKKFHELVVKGYLEQIKNVSLSTDNDNNKLDLLIGANTGLWDPTDPKRHQDDITGIVRNAIDQISDDDFGGFEKIMDMDKNKLLDKLSYFADELRKLTNKDNAGNIQPSGGNLSTTHYDRRTTINVLDGLVKLMASRNLDTKERKEYKLFGYLEFLESLENQKEDSNNQNTEDQKSQTTTTSATTKAPENNSDQKDSEKNTNVAKPTENNTGVKVNTQNTNNNQKSNQNNVNKNVDNNQDDKQKDFETIIENLKKSILAHKSEKTLKADADIKDRIGILIKKLKSENLSDSSIKIDGGSINVGEYLEGLLKSLNSTNESLLMLEDSGVNDSPTTVRQVWENFLGPLDAKKPHVLTSREVEEFNEFMNDPQKISAAFVFNPSLRPDPIISISRIFTNAYNLFATDRIPSGRPGGMVSQKTLREYIKLGGSKNLNVSEDGVKPGPGPWAVKSIFDKFKNGVLKLLQNQEYRKILSNMKFVVPGSEDKFNESLILENENNKPTTSDKSHGQLLLRFMNDMITPSKLEDFEELKNTYINDYFGVKISEKDKNKYKAEPSNKPANESEKTDSLFWETVRFNDSDLKSNNKQFNLFAYPCYPLEIDSSPWNSYKSKIDDSVTLLSSIDNNKGKPKIIFLNRVVGLESIDIGSLEFYPVKLTFNRQYLADKIKEDENYTSIMDWNDGDKESNIHYGYICIDEDNIFLIHASVTYNELLKTKVKQIYYQVLKSDVVKLKNNIEAKKAILWDGKNAQAYLAGEDYTNKGEEITSKDNYDISFEPNSNKISEVMKDEIQRIFN